MNITLSDGTVEEVPEHVNSWTASEVNKHGDLTIYRKNEYAVAAVQHYAAGTWIKAGVVSVLEEQK